MGRALAFRIPLSCLLLAWAFGGCTSSAPAEAPPDARAASPESNEDGGLEVDAPSADASGCARDGDCAPDDPCLPAKCVLRASLGEQNAACEESGPPIGACVCTKGECTEVPFDAPNGRDRARAEIDG